MNWKKRALIALRHLLRVASVILLAKGAISAEVGAGITAAVNDPELWAGLGAAIGSYAMDVQETKDTAKDDAW